MGIPLLDIIDVVGKVVERVIPDPAARADLQYKLAQLGDQEAARSHEELMGQIDVNKVEAANPSVFVAGWRPALGWAGVSAMVYTTVFAPMFHLGMPDVQFIETILLGMLGLNGGMRTLEKIKGVATDNVGTAPAVTPIALPAPKKKHGLWPF